MSVRHDVIIVGAGPAGMSAACTLRGSGLDVLVIDEQPNPGGQIYRAVETSPLRDGPVLGNDYRKGLPLVAAFRASGCLYLPGATVVELDPSLQITVQHGRQLQRLTARAILLATGASERPMPFPGWNLPGVMTAGAAQIALKSAAIAATDSVFAGRGPLLYLVAAQYLRAGVRIRAILDTTPAGSTARALHTLPGSLRATPDILKGWSWLTRLRASGTPYFSGVNHLHAQGDRTLGALSFSDRRGRTRTLEARHLFIHEGLCANLQLPLSAGCACHWNPRQLAWQITTDACGQTSIPGLYAAGDGCRILGADAARSTGEIAGLAIATALGAIPGAARDHRTAAARRTLQPALALRSVLDALYEHPQNARTWPDSTLVCRCECVSAGALRTALAAGLRDSDQLKSLTRAGMGPCQGRCCGASLNALLDDGAMPAPPARIRAPLKPVSLEVLAAAEATPGKP